MNSINKTSDVLLKEIELEDKIRKELSDVILYFDYQEYENMGDEASLSLITISKNHGERFLFHKVIDNSKMDCLIKMLEYITSDYKKNLEHYEVTWKNKKSSETKSQKSWFCGRSFLEVMDKFYYLKDTSDIIIFNIKLMPLS